MRLSLRKAKVSTPKLSTGPDDGRGRASIAALIIRYATARRPEAATGGSGPDRRPAALRAHALRGRDAPVRDAADGGQDDPAAARRHPRDVEHLPGVLPGRAARRLRLRAREHHAPAALAPGAPASDRARGAPGRAAPGREPAPATRRRGQPGARRAHAPVGLGGPALPGGERDRAAAPAVVHPDRAPGRPRSVLPLCGQQPRQHARAAGLPDPGRAAPAPAGPGLAHPDHAVEHGLRRARAPDRPLRADPLVEAGGRHAPGPAPGSGRRGGRAHRAGARLAAPAPLDRPGLRALEPAARRDHLHHHRPGRGAAPVGAAARHLPADLHPRLRPLAAGAPPRRSLHHPAPRPPADLPDGVRTARAHLDHRALALRPALRDRARLSRRARPRPPRAPLVFSSLIEYPLVMVLACVLLHAGRGGAGLGLGPGALRAAVSVLLVAALALVLYSESATLRVDFSFLARVLEWSSARVGDWLDPIERPLNKLLIYGPPLGLAWLLRRRPLHLGLALAAVLLVAGFVDARNSDQIRQSRSFFGVLRISRDRDEKGYTELRHGTTLHGRQSLEPSRRAEPLSYYQRNGPIGQLFVELDRRPGAVRMAVIGLGTGTLAAYARPADRVTFYEIDRLVRDVAFDPRYFTYAVDARDRGASLRMELGDARIRLDAVRRYRPEERYDVILVDAFTSDAIPVHLLTREALRLYFDMLGPRGIIALHISNRYLRLEPVVANLAEDGRYARLLQHGDTGDVRGGVEASWVLLARRPEDFGEMASDSRWTVATLDPEPRVGTWTDDFHNLLSVFKW